jgi:crossover junction endodeoxyribonuclease RusA
MAVGEDGPHFVKHVPVEISLIFHFRRPETASKKRKRVVVKPDLDKLLRATLDALTGVVFHDDAQVVKVIAEKVYGDVEGVKIEAREAA